MQLETKTTSGTGHDIASISLTRRRIRTHQWLLRREAKRRKTRANAMVILSFMAMLVLLKVFYEVLSR
jgi:hypothetical protein